MIICVCNRISDRQIKQHVRAGMSFDDIQLELGVATCCGTCECAAREVVAQSNDSNSRVAAHETGSSSLVLLAQVA